MKLAALIQPHKKAVDPSSYPKPIEPELLERIDVPAGFVVRINYCDVHGIEFYQSISSQVRDGQWKGLCPDCSASKGIERRARTILGERTAEVTKRVAERMPAHAAEIAESVEQRVAEHVAKVRPEIAEDVEWQVRQREHSSVHAELLAEIVVELRGQK